MPQASEEQRAEWGITDANAVYYLESKGYVDAHFCWRLPSPDHQPTEKELSAIGFLMDEWDWGGIVKNKKPYSTSLVSAFERVVVAHEGQTDKAGEPYIGHVLRVMARVARYGAATMTVAALHDVVEDGHATLASIHNDFGGMIGDAVDAITRREGEAYRDYIQRVATNQLATRVKFADLADNSDPLRLQSLPWPEHERLTKKYRQAFMALREAAPREEGE